MLSPPITQIDYDFEQLIGVPHTLKVPSSEYIDLPTSWPATLIGMLGAARLSMALACTSRGTAVWLLRGSIGALASSRSKALALLRTDAWGREQERTLRKIQ